MPRASVAVVGRPNVGKSTLFNTIVGRRIAIEDPTSGVTRDRILHEVRHEDRVFDLVDTGGVGIVDRQDLSEDVERQIALAVEEADAIIFLVDGREGIMPLDDEVADRLRKCGKPVVLAANKVDTDALEEMLPSFHALGFGDALPVSAKQRRGLNELLWQVITALPPDTPEPEYDGETLRIAFVGKRNAGKSSIVNALAGGERVIVSDRPGTTRDAVDILFERDDMRFVAIDTAGVRKRGQVDDSIEFFGQARTERAVRRADVCVFMIDASLPVSRVDKRLGRLIMDSCTPCVMAVNKWDLAVAARPNITLDSYHEYLGKEMPGLGFAPLVATCAATGENVWKLVDVARDLDRQARRRVGTGELNRVLHAAYERQRPPRVKGRTFKIYYGTQPETKPPTFIVFCNNPRLANDQYTRYLAGQLREALDMPEIPIRIWYKSSHDAPKTR